MVHFISKPLPNFDPASELKVASALEALDDSWFVIHSVAWQGYRQGRQGDGEADFVLISRTAGVVVLEVKGGGIEIANGRWKSIDRHGNRHDIKHPFEQAAASKVKLHKWLKSAIDVDAPTMHAVVFPDISDIVDLGPAAPSDLTLRRQDLVAITEALHRVVSHWNLLSKLTDSDVSRMVKALAPTVTIRRTLADEAYDADTALVKLTEEQRRAFSGLRRARRAVVLGGPGTGKTLLAAEKAKQLADDGLNALLVCYNELLAKALAESDQLRDVRVSTFHGLCMSMMRKAELPIPSPIRAAWWEGEAALGLMEAASNVAESFDAIVVDEGQDFSNDWLQALISTLSDEVASPFYIFADADQTLWPRSWEPDANWYPYELSINCRNTKPIAQRVAAIADSPVETIGADGPSPKWTELKRGEDASEASVKAVANLLRSGFEVEDIAVLCESASVATSLSQRTVEGNSFCRYGGTGILVETIARFKGLERTAIVLVMSESDDKPDRSAYVGFSRARTFLQVIAPPSRQIATRWRASS